MRDAQLPELSNRRRSILYRSGSISKNGESSKMLRAMLEGTGRELYCFALQREVMLACRMKSSKHGWKEMYDAVVIVVAEVQ